MTPELWSAIVLLVVWLGYRSSWSDECVARFQKARHVGAGRYLVTMLVDGRQVVAVGSCEHWQCCETGAPYPADVSEWLGKLWARLERRRLARESQQRGVM